MNLYQQIEAYKPTNEQEERDRLVMLKFMAEHPDYLLRTNEIAHFTASMWTVNQDCTKVLMAYHKIYDSWSWIGGHADGEEDLCAVALRELQEETGVSHASLVSRDIFSLESLPVYGHIKHGKYVPTHLHLNVTYLAKADEEEALVVNEAENTGVRWFTFEEAFQASTEPWMVERIYRKLAEKCR